MEHRLKKKVAKLVQEEKATMEAAAAAAASSNDDSGSAPMQVEKPVKKPSMKVTATAKKASPAAPTKTNSKMDVDEEDDPNEVVRLK